jgi:hypothetical protein
VSVSQKNWLGNVSVLNGGNPPLESAVVPLVVGAGVLIHVYLEMRAIGGPKRCGVYPLSEGATMVRDCDLWRAAMAAPQAARSGSNALWSNQKIR